MKCSYDIILPSTIFIGSVSTVIITTLQYTGHINNWIFVIVSSGITVAAVMGSVICKVRDRLSVVKAENDTVILVET